jgi:hypothetical protein
LTGDFFRKLIGTYGRLGFRKPSLHTGFLRYSLPLQKNLQVIEELQLYKVLIESLQEHHCGQDDKTNNDA